MVGNAGRSRAAATMLAAAMSLGPIAPADSADIVRTGRITIVGTLSYKGDIPANTEISVQGTATVSSSAATDRFQSATALRTIRRSGAGASVTLILDYDWILPDSGATIQVGLAALADTPSRLSSQTFIEIALPADGATTRVAIPAAL